jgi:hypothetical protein
MILIAESWESIVHRTGIKRLRRGRGECPFCGSCTGFSSHEDRGFHCFACGIHGDKIAFIQQLHGCGFKDALRFFGLEPGKPPAPDPETVRRRNIREGLRRWAMTLGKELRLEHYVRERVIARAQERLSRDPEDPMAWGWLAWAYKGLEAIAHTLDQLEGNETQQLQAYREWRNTE